MRSLHALATALLFVGTAGTTDASSTQTDWSGGDGVPGPVLSFGDRFASGDLSWRAIEGQVALGSAARASFPFELIAADSDRPTRLAIADIDADGSMDVIVTDPLISPFDPDVRKGAIYLWRYQDGAWTSSSVTEDFFGSWFVEAVDLDQDGDLDLIASAYYGEIDPPPPPPEERNGRYAWFENLDGAGGSWEKRELGELFWGARWVDAVDVDGDGDLDLVGCAELVGGPYEADAFVVWFENLDGQGESWTQHDISDDFDNAFEIQGADVDGDQDMDLMVSGYDRFEWFENVGGSGSTWTRHVVSPVLSGAGYFDLGDLDDDGDVDIIGSGLNNSVLAVWLNDGTGDAWGSVVVGPFARGYNVDLADLDGDGDLDAVASGESGNQYGKLAFAINQGLGLSWTLPYVETLAPRKPWARAGDVNGDGKLELVASFEDSYDQGIQLAAYTITDFGPAGTLQSSVLDGGAAPEWGTITWDADTPAGTSLDVEVRAGDDAGFLGAYVPVPASGTDLAGLIDAGARYVQYRVSMSSSDPSASPVLREIDLDGAVTVAVGDPGALASVLRVEAAAPNPSRSDVAIGYVLPTASRVRAAIYDASGREVVRLTDALRDAGPHSLAWDGRDGAGRTVAVGTYFLRLDAGGERVTRRIVRVR